MLYRCIDAILNDDHLNQSEIIYAFLNPRPEYFSRMKGMEAPQDQEPFSKISRKLFTISQNRPALECNSRAVGLRDIYKKRRIIDRERKEAVGKKSRTAKKSVLPSSISNFFNDSNHPSHADEGGEELKVEFILSTGYVDIFQIIFEFNIPISFIYEKNV